VRSKLHLSFCWTLGLTFIFVLSRVSAQQDPTFGHFQFIKSYVNPAETGFNELTRLSFIYRSQWTGLKSSDYGLSGVPVTQFLMAETKLSFINSGVGLYLTNDVLGSQQSISFKLNYAYHIKLVANKNLSLGMGLGIYNVSFNTGLLKAVNNADPLITYLAGLNKTTPDVNLGISYNTTRYFVGFSIFHANKPQLTNFANSDSSAFLARTYYLTGGYNFRINDLFTITPSFLIRSNLKPIYTSNLELRALMEYKKEQFFSGFTLRAGDAIGMLVGASLLKNSSLKISYAFDITYAGTNAKAGTTNEICFIYSMNKSGLIPKPIIRTPRYRF
jgi:type IX secretion system PorP/SprF family membrane protein